MNKKITALLTALAIILSLQTACMTQQQPIRSDYSYDLGSPDSNWYTPGWEKESEMADPPIGIILGVMVAVVATAVVMKVLHHPKRPILLTKAQDVQLYLHQEAPAEAKFIADVEVNNQQDATAVKIMLRNQAANLGGNLLVIDAINAESHTFNDISYIKYSGCGRVYRMNSPILPPAGD